MQFVHADGTQGGISTREILEAQIDGALNVNQVDGLGTLSTTSALNSAGLNLVNLQIQGSSRQLLPTQHGSTDDTVARVEAPVTVKIAMDDREENASSISPQEVEIATAISSLGLIWMTGRQAILAYSLLASFPAWQRVDPLLLLEKDDEDEDMESADEGNIDIADHLFSNIDAAS